MKTRRVRNRRRNTRRQRGGSAVAKHQILTLENGFETAGDSTGNFFTCGERAIPYDTLLSRNVTNIKCQNGVITGLNAPAPSRPLSVRNRIAALKNAAPPPQMGRLGGSFGKH
jgi:hypothetical protein